MIKGDNLVKKERTNPNLFRLFAQIPQAPPGLKLHWIYEQSDFNYAGYRSDEFNQRSPINVLTIGTDDAFGVALRKQDRFSEVFCRRVEKKQVQKVSNWNLSLPYKSNDYIARMVATAVPILKPDFLMVVFTDLRRREYWDSKEEAVDYVPDLEFSDRKYTIPNMEAWLRIQANSNHHDDAINFYKNYLLIETLMNDLGLTWFFSTSKVLSADATVVERVVDSQKFVGAFPMADTSEDDRHHGIQSHEILAEMFYDKYRV